jgi:hypothetical protein
MKECSHLKPPGPVPGLQGVYSNERCTPAWSMPTMTKGGALPDVMSPAAASAAFQEAPADSTHVAQQEVRDLQRLSGSKSMP